MNWNALFCNINIPIIIYRDDDTKAVVYENASARKLLTPLSTAKGRDWPDGSLRITDILPMEEEKFRAFFAIMEESRITAGFSDSLQLYSGERVPASISAIGLEMEGECYVQVCIYTTEGEQLPQMHALALVTALNNAYRADTTEEAIRNILKYFGSYIEVSRCYIFESMSETIASNTYEWCAAGVEPATDRLKNLSEKEYTYDEIIDCGLTVIDDIRRLPPEERAVLELQGIKALAVIPIFTHKEALGYVGFDDCKNYRKWSRGEIRLLRSFSDMLASLLVRRDVERSLRYSLEILKTVTDGIDNMVFVTDIHRQNLLFCNKALAEAVHGSAGELAGQKTGEVLAKWSDTVYQEMCMKDLMKVDDESTEKSRIWEFFNHCDKKWYLMKDEVLKWIDGQDVIMETATDISLQKEQEARLKHAADTDCMTGVYKREMIKGLMQNILTHQKKGEYGQPNSIIFLDLDGLKRVNDTHGHMAGDRMIMKFVEIAQSKIRKSDILCRWGGDEFVLLIRGNEAQTNLVVEKIIRETAVFNRRKEDVFFLGFSYGVVEIKSGEYKTVNDIIMTADKKMYAQKIKNKKRERKY